MTTPYEQLEDHFRRINHLNRIENLASWDEAVMMPAGGGEARAQAMATLHGQIHQMKTKSKLQSAYILFFCLFMKFF